RGLEGHPVPVRVSPGQNTCILGECKPDLPLRVDRDRRRKSFGSHPSYSWSKERECLQHDEAGQSRPAMSPIRPDRQGCRLSRVLSRAFPRALAGYASSFVYRLFVEKPGGNLLTFLAFRDRFS